MMNMKNSFRNPMVLVILIVMELLLSEFTNYHLSFGPILISFVLLPIALATVYLDTIYAVFFGLIYGIHLFIENDTYRDKSLIGAVFLFIVSHVVLMTLLSLIYRILIKKNINPSLSSGIVFALALPIRLIFQNFMVIPLFFSIFPTGLLSGELYMNPILTWYIPEMITFFIIGFLISFVLNKLKKFCREKLKEEVVL